MSINKRKGYKEIIEIPEKVEVQVEDSILKVKGEKGEIEKNFLNPKVKIKKENNVISLSAEAFSRKEKSILNTFKSHIKNMLKGVNEPYIYKIKICSSHFPITVAVEGDKVTIKNFLGEKIPREANILQGAKVEVKGDIITISSVSVEASGQTAANIEQATRITNKDRRVFQDGCYIFEKAGEPIQ